MELELPAFDCASSADVQLPIMIETRCSRTAEHRRAEGACCPNPCKEVSRCLALAENEFFNEQTEPSQSSASFKGQLQTQPEQFSRSSKVVTAI